uniref:Chondroadherin n=1 Tax=Cacopsylla melanoneura TaxID=428564 RepID=A0A8D8QKM9_9HEMI
MRPCWVNSRLLSFKFRISKLLVACILLIQVQQIRVLAKAVIPCPLECICLSQTQVLCNTGGLQEIPLRNLPKTVEVLSLTKNNFTVIKADAFLGLKNLRKLSLDGNNISHIKAFAFRGLPKLRELSIQHTHLTSISSFSFAGLQNVSVLLLNHNKIHKIEQYSFAGTANMRLLLLNNNPLHRIESNAFSSLSNVEHLILPSGIKVIEPFAFFGLESIGLLKISYMDLKVLQSNTFTGLSKVHFLAIQDSDLGVVEEDAFSGLRQITSLNIMNNKIDSIREFKFNSSNSIKNIRFHGNHILQSPQVSAINVESVDNFSVYNNHFPCDHCNIYAILESSFAKSNLNHFIKHNYCISPLSMNGKPISSLDINAITAQCSLSNEVSVYSKYNNKGITNLFISKWLLVLACVISYHVFYLTS